MRLMNVIMVRPFVCLECVVQPRSKGFHEVWVRRWSIVVLDQHYDFIGFFVVAHRVLPGEFPVSATIGLATTLARGTGSIQLLSLCGQVDRRSRAPKVVPDTSI